MRKIIFWLIGFAIVGALGYGIATKIQSSKPQQGKSSKAKAGTGIAVPVETAPVTIQDMRNIHTFTGTLEPWSRYEVAPKIAGRLENLNVEVGDPVYNGQLLATIDDEEYLQEIEKAKADLGISEALRDELITQFNLAKIEYERATSLKKGKVISESEYDSKRSAYLVKEASLKKAEAELNQKKAILNLAKVRFEYTKIYARWSSKKSLVFTINSPGKPRNEVENIIDKMLMKSEIAERYGLSEIDIKETAPGKFTLEIQLRHQVFNFAPLVSGVMQVLADLKDKLSPDTTVKMQEDTSVRYIGRKYFDAGQMLKANDAILTIIDIQRMKAMVNVIEKDYPLLAGGQEAVVTTDAYPGRIFAGRVRKVTKVLDEYTRQAEVEIEIDNPQLLLRPGMFVKVSIEFSAKKSVQTVPRIAVVNFNDITGVFVVSADRKTVKFIPVETGLIDGERIQIVKPELPHRPVVTLGNHLLYNGIAIKITSKEDALEKSLSKESADKKDKDTAAKKSDKPRSGEAK
jgi:multidrug efflux pump subunit AcrA (membrane-fusion protein)